MAWKVAASICLFLLCKFSISKCRVINQSFNNTLGYSVEIGVKTSLFPQPGLHKIPNRVRKSSSEMDGMSGSFYSTSSKRLKRKIHVDNIEGDDFHKHLTATAPTVNITDTVNCTSSTKNLQEINNVLFNAFVTLTESNTSASTAAACKTYKSSMEKPPNSTNCAVLKAYITSITHKIVCENALLKDFFSSSQKSEPNLDYLVKEANYEKDIQRLNTVIDQLKQNHSNSDIQLETKFNQTLQLYQGRINALLEEIKELKQMVQTKMEDIVVERIRLGRYSEAVEEYKAMKVGRDVSLPSVIGKVYSSGDADLTGHICNFLSHLPYIEDEIVAIEALYEQMSAKGDLNSISMLSVNHAIKRLTEYRNFGNVIESIRNVANDLKGKIRPKSDSVLSALVGNIRSREYSNIACFAENLPTASVFLEYAEPLMNAVYTGKGSVSAITGFLQSLSKASPTIACATPTIKKMKRNGEIYSKEGLQLIYLLSGWNNVISNAELSKEIPSNLRIFEGKKCALKNLHKNYEFLTATNKVWYNNERRLVVTHPNSWSEGDNAKWIFHSKDNGKTFVLYNVKYHEYLYAADDYWKYDDDRRSIYTWAPGGTVRQSYWEIIPDKDGSFKIKNTYHGEKLYAADKYFKYDTDWNRVFTWIPKDEINSENWKFYCTK